MRNLAYDMGFFKVTSFNIPTIVVGNLNVGGTGKSPHIEYLVRLLKNSYRVAVLSRGYKRKSKGFQLADNHATSFVLGDEPMQFSKKFEDVLVAVDNDRVNGIETLLKMENSPEIVLLDDAFQHRKVRAGFYILLTSFGDLYSNDYVLPTGNLRENKKGAKRATIIVVTNCPQDLSTKNQQEICIKLKPLRNQKVYFSSVVYSKILSGNGGKLEVSELVDYKVLLVTGIANSGPLEKYLSELEIDFDHMKFPDHYDFNRSDKKKINERFRRITQDKKIILTTEKDYVRTFSEEKNNIYYLSIEVKIIDNEEGFNQEILKYVRKNSRDGRVS